jgi:hypothetical protein
MKRRFIAMIANQGSAPVFDPKTLGVMYHDATRLTAANDDVISGLSDLAGTNHAAEIEAARNPTFKTNIYNGKSALLFGGSHAFSIAHAAALSVQAPMTILAVVQPTNVSGYRRFYYKKGAYGFGTNGNKYLFSAVTKKDYESVAIVKTDRVQIISATFNTDYSVNFRLGPNLLQTVTGTANMVTSTNNASLGATIDLGEFMLGYFFEDLLCNRVLTPSEWAQLGQYYFEKYNIPNPSVTPYTITGVHAADPMTIPTYDEGGYTVHPDVWDFGTAWNGYRYWMAITPFPSGNADYENPSIFASNDKTTWVVPDGLTNPIEPKPVAANTYNSDPGLHYDSATSTLYCYWRAYNDITTTETIYYRSSTDGITWSSKTQMFQATAANYNTTISPSIVYDGSQYRMYTVDRRASPYALIYRTASTLAGPWSAIVTCNLYNKLTPKHVDMIISGGKYYAAITNETNFLTMATSDDGENWTGAISNTLTGTCDWGSTVYRASIVKVSGGFDLWYTMNTGTTYQTGYTGLTD